MGQPYILIELLTDNLLGEGTFCLDLCVWTFECIYVLTRGQLNLHSATSQQSPQGSSMKGMCAVVGIGRTAVLYIYIV